MALKSYQKSIITVVVSVVLGVGAVIGVCIGAIFACASIFGGGDTELYWDDAYEIVKNEYGCDKVLWYDFASNHTGLLPSGKNLLSNNAICVIAEKDGEEVFLIIPSDPEEPGFFADWKFDYSFTEIIARMESLGVIFDTTDIDGDGVLYRNIQVRDLLQGDEGYNRCDFHVYFEYYYYDDDIGNTVTYYTMQENHELMVYKEQQAGQYEQLS